ncbi:MAG: carotenoid biosynthesis protein [Sediminispirochaetaceae bacterium]
MTKTSLLDKLKKMPREKLLLIIICDFYLFGLIFHAIPATLPYMLLFTPLVLLVFGVLTLYPAWLEKNRSLWIWVVATYAVTLALEIIGVKTGAVFGEYHYGPVLGLKFMEVPLVIGFNWVIVVLGSARLSERITRHPLGAAVIVGAICVVYDYALEPAAIGLDYWKWHSVEVPLQNYAAWFIIAAAATWAYRRFRIEMKSYLPAYYVAVQFIFFIGLQLFVV